MFLFLLFLFPTLVSAFIESQTAPFLSENDIFSFDYFRYFFSFFIVGIFPYWYFFKLTNKKTIVITVSFIRYFVVFSVFFCFILTGHMPKNDLLLSCFDTNVKEIFEFISTLPLKIVLFSAGYWLIYVFLILKTRIRSPEEKKSDFIFYLLCFTVFSAFGIVTQFDNNIFYWSVKAYDNYRKITVKTSKIERHYTNKAVTVKNTAPSLKRTIVIIIGESETADVFKEHLPQFYDLLGKEKNNLIIIPEAETTSTQTIAVLEKLFFIRKSETKKIFNLLNVYKTAGFKTFWLSNQYKSGQFDDFIYVMTKPISFRKYYNYFDFNNLFIYGSDQYDEVLLEGLENALKDPAEKKIIFMHLLCSHNDAKNRYPDTFHSPLVDKKEKKSYSATEHYKNAAAYTNTFLAKALLTLKDQKEPTAAIYFSDHGDDPVVPFARNYNKIKGVPLFFWLSKKYQKQFPNQFKNLNCLQYVYFSNLPYLFNQVIGVDIIDISASSEIKACFAKEENK